MIRALVEVGAAACAGAAGWGAGLVLAGSAQPGVRWGTAAGLGVVLTGLQLVLVGRGSRARRGRGRDPDSNPEPVDPRRFFRERLAGAADAGERLARVAAALGHILESSFDLTDVRLQLAEDPEAAGIDQRVRAWLVANDAPIDVRQVEELRLGGLRLPVVAFVRGMAADLVVPLVYRDRLVALATARGAASRLLRGERAGELRAVQQAAATTLGELLLRAAAAYQAEVVREVEAASTVQHENAPATQAALMAGCRVVRHYAPARRFSGAWWCARELPDGRLFAGIGEVTGGGAPAALLSATAMGVCESATRSLGGGLELHGVLELLHGSVREASGGAFGMSALIALVDVDARIVTFAGAGHPFPFLIRPPVRGREGARGSLRSLVSRGTQLGAAERPVRSLSSELIEPGDVMVFFTASLTDARDGAGHTFGERRLQHMLRRASLVGPVGPDGSDLADQVAMEVAVHVGGRSLDDDIIAATVHVQ